jgi:multimeric flavodoxin WrbA
MPTIVVVFWSRTGNTERLAMSAALGAVQARAQIRLRWLREDVEERALEAVPGWRENRERMSMEYIAPREIDIQGADGLMLLTPANSTAAPLEWHAFFDLVRKVDGAKRVALMGDSLEPLARQAGCRIFGVVDSIGEGSPSEPRVRALSLGRALAKACIS